MKKVLTAIVLILFAAFTMMAQERYLVVTSVESIVPAGIGRSRIIVQQTPVDSDELASERTDGRTSDMDGIRRRDIKIDEFEETKLLNFYSLTGINFQNIASNDAVISDKLNKLSAEGWELKFVTSGVESDSGESDGHGIFITRYIFTKKQ
jgi:hypothetical protein